MTFFEFCEQTENFFAHTVDAKAANTAMTAEYPYGYLPLGAETLAAGKAHEKGDQDTVNPADLNESFSIGPPTTAHGAPPTKWPKLSTTGQTRAFEEAWRAYYAEMEILAATLLRGFALALDLPEKWFEDKIDRHRSALRALNYPAPQPGTVYPPGQLRASAHTDYGSLVRQAAPALLSEST
eukprot:SAG31_NODE_721_length_12587_cov_5.502002_16_plen_182_part_00